VELKIFIIEEQISSIETVMMRILYFSLFLFWLASHQFTTNNIFLQTNKQTTGILSLFQPPVASY
jgi:hypothetical protein